MTEYLNPIYLENGTFFINKNLKLSSEVNICGPVSFLFSCSQTALKKNSDVKLPLPGMFQAIQMYFSIIENHNEYNQSISKLDYLQDVTDKYIEAFFWMKKECNVHEIILREKVFNQCIFNSVVMQNLDDMARYFEYEILFQNNDSILTKFFLNLENNVAIQRKVI